MRRSRAGARRDRGGHALGAAAIIALLAGLLAVGLVTWTDMAPWPGSGRPAGADGNAQGDAENGAGGTGTRAPSAREGLGAVSTPPLPTGGDGTFAKAGAGKTIGSGKRLVRYLVEVERGIDWGTNPAWQPAGFAATVDGVLAAPQGWARSAETPVTFQPEGMVEASWSFRRVTGDFDVRVRLATPKTVDRLCAKGGLDTEGVYSCRVGSTVMINLRRWLHGAPGFAVSIEDYRANVINHELGHFLGFGHMGCPGPGKSAPIMQTQTIDLDGCRPHAYPFAENGRFIVGPTRQP